MKPARMLPTVTFGVAISFFFVPPVLALIGASPAPVRAPAARLSVERIDLAKVRPAFTSSLTREMAKAENSCGSDDAASSSGVPARQLSAPLSHHCRLAISTADRVQFPTAFLLAV